MIAWCDLFKLLHMLDSVEYYVEVSDDKMRWILPLESDGH